MKMHTQMAGRLLESGYVFTIDAARKHASWSLPGTSHSFPCLKWSLAVDIYHEYAQSLPEQVKCVGDPPPVPVPEPVVLAEVMSKRSQREVVAARKSQRRDAAVARRCISNEAYREQIEQIRMLQAGISGLGGDLRERQEQFLLVKFRTGKIVEAALMIAEHRGEALEELASETGAHVNSLKAARRFFKVPLFEQDEEKMMAWARSVESAAWGDVQKMLGSEDRLLGGIRPEWKEPPPPPARRAGAWREKKPQRYCCPHCRVALLMRHLKRRQSQREPETEEMPLAA